MSPLAEIRLVAARELQKSFRSVKGILLAVMSVAGGAGVSMLFAWLDRVKREHLPPGIDLHDAQEQLFDAAYGPVTGKALASCPYSLWMMLIATLWLGPLLVALLDFDTVSGEVQHRSVRFWTVRTRRSSYMVGKVLGAWLSVLAVTFGMNVIVWGVTASFGGESVGLVVGWGLRFFLVTIPISAAWCGIAMLVGSQSRAPLVSLMLILVTFFGLWIVRVVAEVSTHEWLGYVYPNFYDKLLLSPRPADLAAGLLGTTIIAVGTTAAAVLLFERRDV